MTGDTGELGVGVAEKTNCKKVSGLWQNNKKLKDKKVRYGTEKRKELS